MDGFLKCIGAVNDESRVKILKFLIIHGKSCVCELESSLERPVFRHHRLVDQNIFDQLSDDDGILVSPITKGNKQIITKFRKNKYMIVQEEIEECLFVPVLRGVSKAN